MSPNDNMPEWLTGWIANPLLFERQSSSLCVVDFFFRLQLVKMCSTIISVTLVLFWVI